MKQNPQAYFRPQNKQKKSYRQLHHKLESEWHPSKLNRPEQLWQQHNLREFHIQPKLKEDCTDSRPNPDAPLDPKHMERKSKESPSVLEWPKEVRM